jgi:type VI protein secretion system component Hcp
MHSFRTNGANGESLVNDVEDWFAGSSDLVSNAVSTAAVSDPLVTPVSASSPLQYFIKIDGVKGDATVNGTSGWLAVDGFDWDLKNASTVGSASGGAGAGKASFSPLTIDIHSLAGVAALFKDAATGDQLKTAELVGVQSVKGQSLEVYKVDLTDVEVSSFQQDPGSKGVETTLGLNFAQLKITDQPQTTNGKPGTPETASWDVTTNSAMATLSPSDLLYDAQLHQSLPPLAPGTIGSSGSQDPLHPTLMAART